MQIEAYILCNNEELLMPYIMRHYSQFAKVIILESNSTDRTIDIARNMGAEVWRYEVPDEINDDWFTKLKNACWKGTQADWVMVADADEFIYHPNIVKALKSCQGTVIQPRFFNMYSETFPATEGQIYEEVINGVEQTSPKAKMNVFRPMAIKEMNYFPGCHEAFPTGNVRIDDTTEIKTLHMRNLSRQFVIDRNMRARRRNCELNRQMGWGCHVDWTEEEWMRRFDEGISQAIKIC